MAEDIFVITKKERHLALKEAQEGKRGEFFSKANILSMKHFGYNFTGYREGDLSLLKDNDFGRIFYEPIMRDLDGGLVFSLNEEDEKCYERVLEKIKMTGPEKHYHYLKTIHRKIRRQIDPRIKGRKKLISFALLYFTQALDAPFFYQLQKKFSNFAIGAKGEGRNARLIVDSQGKDLFLRRDLIFLLTNVETGEVREINGSRWVTLNLEKRSFGLESFTFSLPRLITSSSS